MRNSTLTLFFIVFSTLLFGQDPNNNKIYTSVDSIAEFKGGTRAYGKFLRTNLRIPVEMKVKGISGKAYIQFVVTNKGLVEDVKVLKDVGFRSGEEAVRFIKLTSGLWNPAKVKGQLVNSQLMYPIEFILGEYIEGYLVILEQSENYKEGLKLMSEEKYEEAYKQFSIVIKAYPKTKGAFYNRGLCCEKLGKQEDACKDWNRAKQLGDKKIDSILTEHCLGVESK